MRRARSASLVVSPASARTILGSIAGSLITIASLTSSLTIVTLQLLSNQYTSRTVRGFLATRRSQVVLGTFIGIFLYCLVLLVAVREPGDENDPFVPSLGVVVAVALAVIGLIVLVLFIHAMSQTIQVSITAARLCTATATAVEQAHNPGVVTADQPAVRDGIAVPAGRTGYVRRVDAGPVLAVAAGVPVHVTVRAGEFVIPATRVALVAADHAEPRLTDAIRRAVDVELERDLADDPTFGIRQLVDIACRALSPGINDPSTAVTCVGYLRSLVEDAAQRPLPQFRRWSATVTQCQPQFSDYMEPLLEIAAYAIGPDARVAVTLMQACDSIAALSVDTRRRTYVLALRDQIRDAAAHAVALPDRPTVYATGSGTRARSADPRLCSPEDGTTTRVTQSRPMSSASRPRKSV